MPSSSRRRATRTSPGATTPARRAATPRRELRPLQLSLHTLIKTNCSLVIDPNLTSLYTNRAICRFNLSQHDGVIADCDTCLAIDPKNMKANYFKSKSLMALGDGDAACEHAQRAYDSCRAHNEDKSLNMTMSHLLQCRTERWQRREKARRREAQDLEREVLEMMGRDTERELEGVEDEMEKSFVREEADKKVQAMKDIFERARKDDDRQREVPEWLIDDISFNVITDPVIVSVPCSRDNWEEEADLTNRHIPDDPTSAHPYRPPSPPTPSIPSRENLLRKPSCDRTLS